jgi:hypothetical protein
MPPAAAVASPSSSPTRLTHKLKQASTRPVNVKILFNFLF